MKLKLSQSSHNIIILVENYYQYIKIYYADGHCEIREESIRDFDHLHLKNHKYKNPIVIESSLLFPTQNQKDSQCQWINLKYLEQRDPLYMDLLKQKGLDKKSLKMYLQHKDELFI